MGYVPNGKMELLSVYMTTKPTDETQREPERNPIERLGLGN